MTDLYSLYLTLCRRTGVCHYIDVTVFFTYHMIILGDNFNASVCLGVGLNFSLLFMCAYVPVLYRDAFQEQFLPPERLCRLSYVMGLKPAARDHIYNLCM
jgi:hypothetical protein